MLNGLKLIQSALDTPHAHLLESMIERELVRGDFSTLSKEDKHVLADLALERKLFPTTLWDRLFQKVLHVRSGLSESQKLMVYCTEKLVFVNMAFKIPKKNQSVKSFFDKFESMVKDIHVNHLFSWYFSETHCVCKCVLPWLFSYFISRIETNFFVMCK